MARVALEVLIMISITVNVIIYCYYPPCRSPSLPHHSWEFYSTDYCGLLAPYSHWVIGRFILRTLNAGQLSLGITTMQLQFNDNPPTSWNVIANIPLGFLSKLRSQSLSPPATVWLQFPPDIEMSSTHWDVLNTLRCPHHIEMSSTHWDVLKCCSV